MTDSFDPYRKWLGIPPQDQPPHHYRLLGVEPFEQDPDVIANAADGRMAQVKRFQTGQFSKLSQRILNEIAAAKVCLLNPEKRAEYDRQLRPRLEAEDKTVPKPANPMARIPTPQRGIAGEAGMPEIDAASVFSMVSSRGRRRRSWPIPVAVGVIGVSLLGVLIFLLSRGGVGPLAEGTTPIESQPEDQSPQATPPTAPVKTPRQEPKGPDSPNGRQEDPVRPPAEPAPTPTEVDPTPTEVDPGRPLSDLLDPPDPGQPGDNPPGAGEPDAPGSDQSPADAGTAPKRLPVPEKDARREAEQRVREIFKKEFAGATTPDGKSALAAKLAKQAEGMTGDATARFALMQLACEQAAEAGELTMTLDLAEQMRQLYDIDVLTFKAYLLDKVIGAVGSDSPTSATDPEFVDVAVLLADEAVAADNVDLAGRLMKLALSAARKMKDAALTRRLTVREREIDRMKLRFATVRKALDVLAEDPSNGEANLTAGRWYCFTIGNWAKGLPLLAKGEDAELAKLASQDMAQPEGATQQMRLADQWWDLAKKEKGPEQRGIQARAAHWYELALPRLADLDKAKVERRLAAMAAAAQPPRIAVRGVVQRGNVALASNGTTVTGAITQAANLLDGQTLIQYKGFEGVGYGTWPCEWTITFKEVYRLQEIRFRLWDNDKRYYRYAVATSADGEDYTPLADRSRGQWFSWQRIVFPPRPVKAIKFRGIYNSANKWFSVIEFEAYCIPPRTPPR